MARNRDRKAELARRDARARAEGWRNYGEKRRAQVRGETRPERYRAQLPEIRKAAAAKSAQSRRQVHRIGGKRLVTTTAKGRGFGVLQANLRGLSGRQVTVSATVRTSDGSTRTVNLFGRGGYNAGQLAGLDPGAVVALIASAYAGESWAEDLTADDVVSVQVQEQ